MILLYKVVSYVFKIYVFALFAKVGKKKNTTKDQVNTTVDKYDGQRGASTGGSAADKKLVKSK